MLEKKQIKLIEEKAKAMRHHIIDMIGCEDDKVGHLGGSCSAADIVASLYFYKMNIDANNMKDPSRDYFLLSKGHAALVQYGALAELGVFSIDELHHVKECGAMLQGHPDMTKTLGIEANTGSLGQGISIALGVALGLRLDNKQSNVYVMMGDGEQAEGQIWEAAMAAAHFKTGNLIGIVDRNRVQAMGTIDEGMDSGDLIAKWSAFGWHVIEVDGHDISSICQALDAADEIKDRPVVIIANTIKGKGVCFAEGKAAFHNGKLTPAQFEQAHADIDAYSSN